MRITWVRRLISSLSRSRRFVVVVLPRQAVEVQRLADLRLHPAGEAGVELRPALEPRVKVLLGLLQVAAVVEPAQILTVWDQMIVDHVSL